MTAIKVFVIDDSAVVRQLARQVLDGEPGIEVLGVAANPRFALERMRRVRPEVVILGMDAPDADGLVALRQITAEHPVAVLVYWPGGAKEGGIAMRLMAAGVPKTVVSSQAARKSFLQAAASELVAAVRAVAGYDGQRRTAFPRTGAISRPLSSRKEPGLPAGDNDAVVAIGTSTGGTQALETVLTSLPAGCPGIVVVQHMPERFTAMFAERLDQLCQLEVREAVDGDPVRPGLALIAPGGRHMRLRRRGGNYQVEVADGSPVNRHKPSVDVLFQSVARVAGKNALGVIMTGMGDDGAQGLKEMHEAGARTVAEDESSCVVFGMPKEAIQLGGVDRVVALDRIAQEILLFARERQPG